MRVRVLAANGIRTRHVALDETGAATMLNEQLAAEAIGLAVKDRGLRQSHHSGRPSFDAEFLRWTLSDGAGAVVVEPIPGPTVCH